METTQTPQQNTFTFDYPNTEDISQTSKITFSSVFDSGNLLQAIAVSPDTYILHTAPDCYGTQYQGTQKSWYYYSVKGVPNGVTLNFTIKKISILASLYRSAPESYKPVCKIGNGEWTRIEGKALLQEDPVEKTLDVKFSYTFSQPEDEVFFAFSFPFSYVEAQNLINQYTEQYSQDRDIYYHHEVIIKSPQDRAIDLITVSSHEGKLNDTEPSLDENLFPDCKPRAQKFRGNKPVLLITARVHPGETPASHTMNGILRFLLDKNDVRAQLLRKYFVFMLMPMINPDGVANGHYRMDIYNQNLNRYYKNPDLKRQPAIYAVKKVIEYLHSEDRLFFFCDLHAHAAKKGCFLYGNALDFVTQVESMLYSKIIGLNCINFEADSCNFSEKHMKARDRGEKLTKEGAARVCAFKTCNLIYSYTLECGLHYSNELSKITMPSSSVTKEWHEDDISDINSDMYKDSPTYYTIKIYENLGKSMLVSILDTFEKNPCSRLPAGTLDIIRKEIAARIIKNKRFWKEANIKKKLLKINEAVKELLYDEFERKNVFGTTVNNTAVTESQLGLSSKRSMFQLTQTPTTARSLKKQAITMGPKLRTDENTDDDGDRLSLPPLKTLLAPRELKLRQTADLRIPQVQVERLLLRDEYFQDFFGKKSSLHNTQRSIERGALAMSEVNTSRDLRTPGRFTVMRREESNTDKNEYAYNYDRKQQGFPQPPSVEAPRHARKASSLKPKYNRNLLEKKKTLPVIKLPELEMTQVESSAMDHSPLLFVMGNKNYTLSKLKTKLAASQTLKKQK